MFRIELSIAFTFSAALYKTYEPDFSTNKKAMKIFTAILLFFTALTLQATGQARNTTTGNVASKLSRVNQEPIRMENFL